jgi:hypothetical protein
LAKHFKTTPANTLQELFYEVDLVVANLPLRFQEVLVVYETFPVFGEFMFPKRNSYLWQLIESTDAPMLLTDGMVTGKESLFVCQPSSINSVNTDAGNILNKLRMPSLCVNHHNGLAALIYPVVSL